MEILLYLLLFLMSCFVLAFASSKLVDTLSRIAKFLGWKEFVVAFFLMAFAVSIPNFFIGIISALNGVPELSFSDVIGGNIIDLSLVIGLAALVSKGGLSAPSRTVQGSCFFTIIMAVLPLLLISDGVLSRGDGILLFLVYLFYVVWLFSKRERFTKDYNEVQEKITLKSFFKNLGLFLFAFVLLIIAAEGMVKSAVFFADYLKVPLSLIGVLIVGLGSSMPETFFSLHAARKGHDWLIFGDLMGGIVITSTLVLGTVALIHPIMITYMPTIIIGRIFLIIAALSFFVFTRTEHKVTKTEALCLLGIYIVFVLVEILAR